MMNGDAPCEQPGPLMETVAFLESLERDCGLWAGVEIRPNQTTGHFVIELWPGAIDSGASYVELFNQPGGRMLLTSACAKLGRVKAGSGWYPTPLSRNPPPRTDQATPP
jgi:hypothetical protein